eukprot:3215048-Pleurochrysis_carterae.AAC.1
MGVQIDGKRVANFAHLSDLDDYARDLVWRWSKRCPLEKSSMSATRWRCLYEEALHRADPDSGEITEVVAR